MSKIDEPSHIIIKVRSFYGDEDEFEVYSIQEAKQKIEEISKDYPIPKGK